MPDRSFRRNLRRLPVLGQPDPLGNMVGALLNGEFRAVQVLGDLGR
jgi:hypothetical protein